MHKTLINLQEIKNKIYLKKNINHNLNIIAVSKTHSMNDILPLIQSGHKHYGENKVQEAVTKWEFVKSENIKLHMIGQLQTNKVKYVIPLFDYIHSLDSLKLAEKISTEKKKKNKNLKIFIQVNMGDEKQKGGVRINEVSKFYEDCKTKFNLNIIGLMCIPPIDKNRNLYFAKLRDLNCSLGLKELSMGMSSDYIDAIKYGSTFIRIGSDIFGKRN